MRTARVLAIGGLVTAITARGDDGPTDLADGEGAMSATINGVA